MRTNTYRAAILLGLFFVLAGGSARAQFGGTVETAVPFDFHADGMKFPAGTYTITRVMPAAMRLLGADGEVNVAVHAPTTAYAQEADDSGRLVFRRYGEQYFLAEVWMMGERGYELIMSDRERNLVKELKRRRVRGSSP
jgi:hypothetical protein